MKVHDRVRDLAHYSSRFIHDTPKRMSTTELTAVTDFSCEEWMGWVGLTKPRPRKGLVDRTLASSYHSTKNRRIGLRARSQARHVTHHCVSQKCVTIEIPMRFIDRCSSLMKNLNTLSYQKSTNNPGRERPFRALWLGRKFALWLTTKVSTSNLNRLRRRKHCEEQQSNK